MTGSQRHTQTVAHVTRDPQDAGVYDCGYTFKGRATGSKMITGAKKPPKTERQRPIANVKRERAHHNEACGGTFPSPPEDKTKKIWGQEAPEDRETQADRGEGSGQGNKAYEACGGTPLAPPEGKTERHRERPRREKLRE